MVNHKLRLHLGCGKKKKKRYVNIDKLDFGQEIIRDIEKGLPFCDNSCIEIYSEHTFEHIKDLEFLIKECWRVLKPDGILKVIVPHKNQDRAYWILHKHYFTEETFKTIAREYSWQIIRLYTNERPDIYCEMKPLK